MLQFHKELLSSEQQVVYDPESTILSMMISIPTHTISVNTALVHYWNQKQHIGYVPYEVKCKNKT